MIYLAIYYGAYEGWSLKEYPTVQAALEDITVDGVTYPKGLVLVNNI